jgi:hypothetical protein
VPTALEEQVGSRFEVIDVSAPERSDVVDQITQSACVEGNHGGGRGVVGDDRHGIPACRADRTKS